MARQVTPLTAIKLQNAKPKDKEYKLSDGQGLYILIKPSGGRLWRFKYRYNNKEKVIAIGKYPEVSLSSARKTRMLLREEVAAGLNPIETIRASKEKHIAEENVYLFKQVSTDYLNKRKELAESYMIKLRATFKNDVYPFLGTIPITEIKPKEIIETIKRVENRGAIEGAHRLYTQINKVFKYAVSNQICERNPCSELDKNEILKSPIKRHYPTITDPYAIKVLLESIKAYSGDYTTRMALLLAPHVFLRPYNIRYAEWNEIDFDEKVWRIPANKMKTKQEHLVPLTDSTIRIFEEMLLYSADAKYIFHSLRSTTAPMSDATMNNALRRMGYSKEELVIHGFRAMFSTIAHEKSDFKHEVIETQLAHSTGSRVSQAYNRAQYLDERKRMMEWWSKYLTRL